MPKRFWISLMTAVLLLAAALPVQAQGEASLTALTGLTGVFILIDPLPDAVSREGLGEAELLQEVTARLDKAGLRVLSRDEWLKAPGSPYLHLRPLVLRLTEPREYVYAVDLSLKENALLEQDARLVWGVAVWQAQPVIGITGVLAKVREAVLTQVDRFVEAFFRANRD